MKNNETRNTLILGCDSNRVNIVIKKLYINVLQRLFKKDFIKDL